jgi:hypothetical protein
MKFLAEYIMRGKLQATLVASALAILSMAVPPASILSLGSVALYTLRRGTYETVTVVAYTSLLITVVALFFNVPIPFVVYYALILWSTWSIAIALRESQHFSLALEIAFLMGIVYAVGSRFLIPDPVAMWKQALSKIIPENAPIEDPKQFIGFMATYMTQAVVVGGFINIMLGLLMGRWWQALLYNPGGFRQEFLAFKIPPKLAAINLVIIVVAGLGIMVFPEVAGVIFNLVIVLYAFVGIAVLHTLISRSKLGQFAVPMFYITLFFIPRILLPVALVGFSDTWLDIRKRTLKQI